MMYSATDNSKVAFTSLENNIGVTSMGGHLDHQPEVRGISGLFRTR